jgi:hypothetical protein
MACALPAGQADADAEAVDALLARLGARNASRPFFAALGLQAPRLPWVYPAAQAARSALGDVTARVAAESVLLEGVPGCAPTRVPLPFGVRLSLRVPAMRPP